VAHVGNCWCIAAIDAATERCCDARTQDFETGASLGGDFHGVRSGLPRWREIALVGGDDSRGCGRRVEQSQIVVRQSPRSVQHDHRHGGNVACADRACDSFRFDRVRGLAAHACRIDERDRNPFDVDDLGQQVSRGARDIGDDRTSRTGELIEQARFA
jgi:hypothetical protein